MSGSVSGRAYLWAIHQTFQREHLGAGKVQNPGKLENPQRFVRDLVHETLRDEKGYVDDVTKSQIDEMIRQVTETRSIRSLVTFGRPRSPRVVARRR
jgi:hypothetical protein